MPVFVDYLYLSVTNSSAFSPTDTMPLTSRAKVLMGAQATAALLTSLLVIAGRSGRSGEVLPVRGATRSRLGKPSVSHDVSRDLGQLAVQPLCGAVQAPERRPGVDLFGRHEDPDGDADLAVHFGGPAWRERRPQRPRHRLGEQGRAWASARSQSPARWTASAVRNPTAVMSPVRT